MEKTKTLSQWLNIKYMVPVCLMLAVLLLAGCAIGGGGTTSSGSTPTATTGSGITAVTPTSGVGGLTPTITTSSTCSLVTANQAGTILGGTVQTRSSTVTTGVGTTNANACVYTSSQGPNATLAVVTTSDATIAQTTFSELQQTTKISAGSKYQDVTGLGDGAFTNGATLYVLKGKTLMIITVTNSDLTKVLPQEKQFAQDALPQVS
jgi:hypothetical protein